MMETPYYLTHFWQVIHAVQKHYEPLLLPKEHAYLKKLHHLSKPAICLYVRLANRKGPYFRASKLVYEDCMPLQTAMHELLEAGLLITCHQAPLPYGLEALWSCFSHAELRGIFQQYKGHRAANKAEYCEWLESKQLHLSLINSDVIALPPQDCWAFLKFLYFGKLTDNLSGFVVQELGHIVPEPVQGEYTPQFASRQEAEDCFKLAQLYQNFYEKRGYLSALELYQWWQEQDVKRHELCVKAQAKHDKIMAKLGYQLEREHYPDLAKRLYASAPVAPCRERYAKLLVKEGQKEAAVEMCHAILLAPEHADEAYRVRQLLNRLQGKTRRSDARALLNAADKICLDLNGRPVEAAVLEYYKTLGWQGIHSENGVWNALFGLFFWDIIYDPRYHSFHQPLQIKPSDLYHKQFYEVRAPAIEARLALLADKARCLEWLRTMYASKEGITNPFLNWHPDMLLRIERLVSYIPAKALAAVLRHMAQDVKQHGKGFPDLFLWRGQEYMLREVKSPNDQLSPQQFNWLSFFQQHGINVSTLKVSQDVSGQVHASA